MYMYTIRIKNRTSQPAMDAQLVDRLYRFVLVSNGCSSLIVSNRNEIVSESIRQKG
jgi:hypothetical protein